MRAEKGQGEHSMLLAQPPGPDILLGQDEASLGSKSPSQSQEFRYGNHCTGGKRAAGLEMR